MFVVLGNVAIDETMQAPVLPVPGATVLTGSCTFPFAYWTSTTQTSTGFTAWYVDQYGSVYPSFKSSTFPARAVRGGTP